MGPEEARRRARLQFGSVEATKEAYRDRRGLLWLEQVRQDVRYAMRMLRRAPGFTVVATVSLAIGIGGAGAVFSLADALLLRPLNVPRAREVVTVASLDGAGDAPTASYRDYVDVRARSRSFNGLAASSPATVGFSVEPATPSRASIGMLVSDNFFEVMEIEPHVGRFFLPAEQQVPGRNPVIVLSHDLWMDWVGADRAVSGRVVRLNGIDFTVVGVTPEGFTGLDRYTHYQFYVPLMMWPRLAAGPEANPLEERTARALILKGRLAAGTTMAGAQAELSVIATDLEREYPETNRNRRLVLQTEIESRMQDNPSNAVLLTMLGLLAGAVLVVACANVAGLLMSRAPGRAREVAMRLAVGARRARVARQFVTENLLLASMGGALSLVVAYGGVSLFRQFRVPTELPIALWVRLDGRVVLVCFIAAVLSALLFGLSPALWTARTDLTAVTKGTEDGSFVGRRRWGRMLLVWGQVTVSVVLLFAASFVYRDFQERIDAGPGFRTEGLLLMWFSPGLSGYDGPQTQRFFDQVLERARVAPGVESATLTSYMPVDGSPPVVTVWPESVEFPPGRDGAVAPYSGVASNYFDLLEIPIVRGRALRETDSESSPRVAVVNEAFAEQYWFGEDAVGKRFRVEGSSGPWVEIVGVARTSKHLSLLEGPTPFLYFSYRQHPSPLMALIAASDRSPTDLVTPLRGVVQGIDAGQGIYNTRTMAENYRLRAVVIVEILRRLIGALGLMGLTLAVIGLYGLLAYATSRRTREIGIRMAIGARRVDVLRMMMRQGVTLVALGMSAGLSASVAVNRGLVGMFPNSAGDTGRLDVSVFAQVAVVVFAVTLMAIAVPAVRAMRIDPTTALRAE
jgi:putative ABC transport system permease protein